MTRGSLRIYLGAAPGVGTTFAMLGEGHRRSERGTDVVVAIAEAHGRPATLARLEGLEVVPGRRVADRTEMDLGAVLRRRPEVALVDDLAHANPPGEEPAHRWEDVEVLRDAGIDVISTLDVAALDSLTDVIEAITGTRREETVPDRVVRSADQIELVDMAPEALRRRLAHGNVFAPDDVDAALADYFRIGNLTALRELSLLWVADEVDAALQRYRIEHDIHGTWETRERVVVAITGAPSGEQLIRRAARMAARTHGDLLGVHVRVGDTDRSAPGELLRQHQQLVVDLGGAHHQVVTPDVAEGLVAFARSVDATQLVLGATRRSRVAELVHGSVINKVIRLAGDLDVHVISQDPVAGEGPRLPPALRRRASPLPRRRQLAGWVTAGLALPALTLLLDGLRASVELPTILILYLSLVVVVAAIGGLRPALASALAGAVVTNWFFTEPLRTLHMDDPEQIVAVVLFVATGALVSVLVGQTARHSTDAQRARAEAEALATAAGGLSAERDPLSAMLGQLRITFGQEAAALLAASPEGGWSVAAVDGDPMPASPDDGEAIELPDGLVLCLVPGDLTADDRRILGAFTARLVDALERRSLEEAAAEASAHRRADELRTAILRAVSHDLRSPLATIKASATSLLSEDVDWSVAQRRDFAQTIDEEADRLDGLVANLLDMSRIEAGVVEATARPVGLDEVVASALDSLSEPAGHVHVALDDDLPAVVADPGLLERVVANVVSNALAHTAVGTEVRIEAAALADRAVLRVIDRGPGVTRGQRDRMFDPFQRFGDGGGGGVGLGLAVARGFMAAMGGGLEVEDTPGGGLTCTLSLPLDAGAASPDQGAPGARDATGAAGRAATRRR